MDDGPQRVEIELTETSPSRSRRSRRRSEPERAAPTPATAGEPRPSPGPDRPPWQPPDGAVLVSSEPVPPADPAGGRRQLVVVGVGVAVVALLAGWVLGRAGDGGSAQTVDQTTTVTTDRRGDTEDATTTDTVLSGDSLPDATVPTTTRPPRTTTTTTTQPPTWQSELVAVAPALAGVRDVVVMTVFDRGLLELDLGRSTLRTLDLPSRFINDTYTIAIGPSWTLLGSGDGALVLRDGSTEPERVPFGTNGEALWQRGTDRFWDWSFGVSATLREVTLDGEATGAEVDIPVNMYPTGVDWGGGVYFGDSALGTFVADGDGSIRLPGLVLADGPAGWLLRACGNTIDSCNQLVFVERDTLETRPVPVAEGIDVTTYQAQGRQSSGLSPDGRRALLVRFDDRGAYQTVLDLETGEAVDFGNGFYSPGTWSSDGRFILYADGVRLMAYDVANDQLVPILDDPLPVQLLSVRPGPPG